MNNVKVRVEDFNPYQLCFPVLKAKQKNGEVVGGTAKFLGTSVVLDKSENKLITCKHLYDKCDSNEELFVFIPELEKSFLLENIKYKKTI